MFKCKETKALILLVKTIYGTLCACKKKKVKNGTRKKNTGLTAHSKKNAFVSLQGNPF